MRNGLLFAAFTVVALSSWAWADCGDAYFTTICNSCEPDSSGNFNLQCISDKEALRLTCYDAKYPVTMLNYHEGECEEVADCLDTLRTCDFSATTGNDTLDCQTLAVRECHRSLDTCMQQANAQCRDRSGGPTCLPLIVLLVMGGGISLVALHRN